MSTGQIYSAVIGRERRGDFLREIIETADRHYDALERGRNQRGHGIRVVGPVVVHVIVDDGVEHDLRLRNGAHDVNHFSVRVGVDDL